VFPEQTLEACVRRFLPGVARVTFAPIPTGKFNTSYFVDAGGAEYVLRIAPPRDAVFVFYERDMMRQEPGIHELLLGETSVPVARVIGHDDSHAIVDRDFLLMDRLPGRPLCDAANVDPEPVMRKVGACLAQAHGLTAGQYGYLGAHAPMAPQPTWWQAFRTMWRRLIEDVAATGHYSTEEAQWFIGLLEERRGVFDRPVAASLLHMDVWSQNILVSEHGRLTGLVDWDRALWGDPEIEFAVLDYCGISTPAFWEGYGRPRDTSPEAAVRNLFYLLYEVQKYIVIRHGRSHDPAGARQYKVHTMALVRRLEG